MGNPYPRCILASDRVHLPCITHGPRVGPGHSRAAAEKPYLVTLVSSCRQYMEGRKQSLFCLGNFEKSLRAGKVKHICYFGWPNG